MEQPANLIGEVAGWQESRNAQTGRSGTQERNGNLTRQDREVRDKGQDKSGLCSATVGFSCQLSRVSQNN